MKDRLGNAVGILFVVWLLSLLLLIMYKITQVVINWVF